MDHRRESYENDSSPHERTPMLKDQSRERSSVHGLRAEIWLLLRYSLPLVVTYLLQFLPYVLTTLIAGHLSADDLAAASIGGTTVAICGSAFIQGMATALDTLCAQTYGAGNLIGVGIHVQRMILLMTATCIPIGTLWLFSPSLLPFVVNLIGLPGQAFYEAGKRFLQVQQDYKAGMVIALACTPLNVFMSWAFAFPLGMGLNGAALGSSITQVLRSILLLLYVVRFARWSHNCWGGLSRDALKNWYPMVVLSLAGSAAVLSEYAAFEIITFSTSYLSTAHLAAQSILTTISIVSWHLPFTVSVVSSTRIGHLVGAGQAMKARHVAIIHGLVSLGVGCTNGIVTILFRNQLPRIFTQDPQTLAICAASILSVSFFQIAEATMCGTNGLLRGLGRQSFAACVVFVVNYLAAVPLALWLELGSPGWGLDGFWLGLPIGMLVISCIEAVYMKFIRWDRCVDGSDGLDAVRNG